MKLLIKKKKNIKNANEEQNQMDLVKFESKNVVYKFFYEKDLSLKT